MDSPFTYEHLAESLDISLPSLRKKIADINKTLDGTYRFKLKVTPISIIGNEKDIRFFFSQFFHEAYNFLDWPFEEVKEENINDFVSFFINLAKFPAKYQNLYQSERRLQSICTEWREDISFSYQNNTFPG